MDSINVKNILALCHILKEYEEFIKDANEIEAHNFSFILDITRLSLKQKKYVPRKVKSFYKKHKVTINVINDYSKIDLFLHEALNGEIAMQSMFKYLSKHTSNMEQILTLLEHIKSLGFNSVHLDETADFSKKEYNVCVNPIQNFDKCIGYLENLERIPTYGTKTIKYKSKGSHYKIEINCGLHSNKLYKFDTIYVNSLLFDPNLLPIEANDPNALFEEIISLREEKVEECEKITDAVDLKIRLMDLEKQMQYTKNMIKNLSLTSEKESLEDSVRFMELEFVRMKQISDEYDKRLIEDDFSITEEILKKERRIRKSILDNIF